MEERIEGFPPVAEADARLLILGSMPSVESLKQGFYYAHPRNAFWRILAEVFDESLPDSIEDKKRLLIDHRIALWDVAHSCVRPGSLDSNIKNAYPNDFSALFRRCPGIRKTLFNGATAENLYRKLVGKSPCAAARMPSTSPALTTPYSEKCAIWRKELEEER